MKRVRYNKYEAERLWAMTEEQLTLAAATQIQLSVAKLRREHPHSIPSASTNCEVKINLDIDSWDW